MTPVTVAQAEKNLKRARKPVHERCATLGITNQAIADEAHCSKTYVVHYWAGRRSPRAVELAIEKLLLAANSQRRSA